MTLFLSVKPISLSFENDREEWKEKDTHEQLNFFFQVKICRKCGISCIFTPTRKNNANIAKNQD